MVLAALCKLYRQHYIDNINNLIYCNIILLILGVFYDNIGRLE